MVQIKLIRIDISEKPRVWLKGVVGPVDAEEYLSKLRNEGWKLIPVGCGIGSRQPPQSGYVNFFKECLIIAEKE